MAVDRNLERCRPYIEDMYDGSIPGAINVWGWTCITLPNKIIYMTADNKSMMQAMEKLYNIPEGNIVNLISEPAIPEPGKFGNPLSVTDLQLFKNKLQHLNGKDGNILIHCKHGTNRTPVATFIYLVEHMNINPSDAERMVQDALNLRAEQSGAEYKFDRYGNYKNIIEEVKRQYQSEQAKRATANNLNSNSNSNSAQNVTVQPTSDPNTQTQNTTTQRARNYRRISEKEVTEVNKQAATWMRRGNW